ncbi:MAG: ABC transporter permease subunit, partial [Spirochaetaceae bacterium]|nr:ABC transporter permease subunit [Spirochaetaceae bacterium]
MPFAALKENRVVDGIMATGFRIAGPWIGSAAAFCALAVAAAAFLSVDVRTRRLIYALVGAACFWMTAGLLVRGGGMLPEGAAPRVSPALGFWGLPAASYVLIDHSKLAKVRGGGILFALILLVPAALILSGGRGEAVSVFREWNGRQSRFLAESLVHLKLFASAVAAAAVIGIPLGIAASRDKKIGGPVIAFVDAAQTIPSMALFGLLMAPLAALSRAVPFLRAIGVRGIGAAPALIALALYALLPIVRNTVIGLASVPISSFEAGRGMGMSPKQLFWRVEWPMALPHVLTGLRTASVQAVGNTAVA